MMEIAFCSISVHSKKVWGYFYANNHDTYVFWGSQKNPIVRLHSGINYNRSKHETLPYKWKQKTGSVSYTCLRDKNEISKELPDLVNALEMEMLSRMLRQK